VVRRVASNHRRARRTQINARVGLAVEEELRPPDPTPFEYAQRDADLHLLRILLGQLDPAKREVFALVELEQLTVPEVAEMLGIPLNTAYSRLRLARHAFETALARHGKREEGFRA
jgi:RNA polymerase sigma-70 factor (ECF subfamily)